MVEIREVEKRVKHQFLLKIPKGIVLEYIDKENYIVMNVVVPVSVWNEPKIKEIVPIGSVLYDIYLKPSKDGKYLNLVSCTKVRENEKSKERGKR